MTRRDTQPNGRIDLVFGRFAAPRYWGQWILWLGLNCTARLPFRFQMSIGRLLGAAAWLLLRRQRAVAARNLELCFPDWSAADRHVLLRRHFSAIGMSFMEMGIGWFMPMRRLERLFEIHGLEHLERATANGRGVLLFGSHCTTVETGVVMLRNFVNKRACMFRPQRNEMVDAMIRQGRKRFADRQIPRDDVRQLIRLLRDGYAVVYLPDQTYLGNHSALLPFFGEPALTNTATSKLARIARVEVLTYFYRRLEDGSGYRLDIGSLPGIPSDDATADARRLFAALEEYIRLAPEQYLWTYKKFKRRPAGLSDPYRNV